MRDYEQEDRDGREVLKRFAWYVRKVRQYSEYRGPVTDRRRRRYIRLMRYKADIYAAPALARYLEGWRRPEGVAVEAMTFQGQPVPKPLLWTHRENGQQCHDLTRPVDPREEYLRRLVREDAERPVCKWSEDDRKAYRELYGRVPACKCGACKTE